MIEKIRGWFITLLGAEDRCFNCEDRCNHTGVCPCGSRVCDFASAAGSVCFCCACVYRREDEGIPLVSDHLQGRTGGVLR